MASKVDERAFLQQFIELYKQYPELWNVKCKEYNDRNRKNIAYEILTRKYKDFYKTGNREMVRRKLNILRTNYRKELRKIKHSHKSATSREDIYKPKLWYFDALNFLQEHETSLKSPHSMNKCEEVELIICDYDTTLQDQFNNETISLSPAMQGVKRKAEHDELHNPAINHLNTPNDGNEIVPARTTGLRKRTDIGSGQDEFLNSNQENRIVMAEAKKNGSRHDELLNLAINCLNTPKDEYETIASTWAIELQKMEAEQQIFAKRFISEILYEGQLGSLHRNSMTMNMQQARWYPSPASSSTETPVPVKDSSVNHYTNN